MKSRTFWIPFASVFRILGLRFPAKSLKQKLDVLSATSLLEVRLLKKKALDISRFTCTFTAG